MGKCLMCNIDYCSLNNHFKRMKHYCKICNKSYRNINAHLKGNKHNRIIEENIIEKRIKKGTLIYDRPRNKIGRPYKNIEIKQTSKKKRGRPFKKIETHRERWLKYLELHPEFKKSID